VLTDDDNSGPDKGEQNSRRSNEESSNYGLATPQGGPTLPPPASDDRSKAESSKPRLMVRLWRIHRRRQKKTSPPNVAEKITVLLILVTACIGALQAFIYYQQKQIMQSSGQQTDQLIEAADTQARASRRIALASRRESRAADRKAEASESFASTANTAVSEFEKAANESNAAAQRQANAAEKSVTEAATAAQNALNTTLYIAQSDQRAWIGFKQDAVIKFECRVSLFKAVTHLQGRFIFNEGRNFALIMSVR
jgi:hypothetical protein